MKTSDAVNERVVKLSKRKNFLLLLGALAFVAIGAWLFLSDESPIHRGLGAISILFFGLCAVVGVRKLFDIRPGLVLNHQGISVNSSGAAPTNIPWEEIQGFSEYEVRRQKMVVVLLKNPEKFYRGSAMAQAVQRANQRLCGSPIAISANLLEIVHSELVDLLQEFFAKYRRGR